MSERVGIVGLGVMGAAMAKNLLAANHEVLGFDLAPQRRQIATDAGVTVLSDAASVAERADVVILSLPTVEALAAVADEIAADAPPGLLCLETGTFPLSAKSSARDVLAKAGVELMDTPLSGTGLQAADATLVVFASGTVEAFERARSIFGAIGRSTHYLGEFGNGSKMKYIANLLVTIHNLATAEAHVLGMAAGMDPAVVQEVMEDGVGSSKIFEIRGPMMVAGEYPAAARLDIILKDARIIEKFAQGVGAPTPLLDAALEVYTQTSSAGLGDFDAAVLFEHLRKQAGLD